MEVTTLTLLTAINLTTFTVANEATTATPALDVRVVGSTNQIYAVGYVQVVVSGVWWSVCDYGWDINDASVACAMLGFDRGVPFEMLRLDAYPGDPIWKKEFLCQGHESHVNQCPVSDVTTTCSPATITCDRANPNLTDGDIRLAGGPTEYSGRLEVSYQGLWGTVCDRAWNDLSAGVVCSMLGYQEGGTAVRYSDFGVGMAVFVDGVTCEGQETSFEQCMRRDYLDHACVLTRTAGVVCHQRQFSNLTGELRVVGSDEPDKGYLQISFYGVWGTICNWDWQQQDTSVVCRQLGYEFGKTAKAADQYRSQWGPIWLTGLNCGGNESAARECKHRKYQAVNCGHEDDVIVECYNTPDQELKDGNKDSFTFTLQIVMVVIGCAILVIVIIIVMLYKKKPHYFRSELAHAQLALKPACLPSATHAYGSVVITGNNYNPPVYSEPTVPESGYTYIQDCPPIYLDLADSLSTGEPALSPAKRANTPLPDLPSFDSNCHTAVTNMSQHRYRDNEGYLLPLDWTNIPDLDIPVPAAGTVTDLPLPTPPVTPPPSDTLPVETSEDELLDVFVPAASDYAEVSSAVPEPTAAPPTLPPRGPASDDKIPSVHCGVYSNFPDVEATNGDVCRQQSIANDYIRLQCQA